MWLYKQIDDLHKVKTCVSRKAKGTDDTTHTHTTPPHTHTHTRSEGNIRTITSLSSAGEHSLSLVPPFLLLPSTLSPSFFFLSFLILCFPFSLPLSLSSPPPLFAPLYTFTLPSLPLPLFASLPFLPPFTPSSRLFLLFFELLCVD